MSKVEEINTGQLLIMEYEHIKDEQKSRIGFRDNLLYATLASMAAVVATALSSSERSYVLLLLPPASLILGWTYLVNDEKISAIGRYIRMELAPRLAELTTDRSPIFGWETAHRSDRHRVSRKYVQLAVDLGTFCGAPLVSIAIFWLMNPSSIPLVVVSALELAAIIVLATQILTYADLQASG